MVSTLLLSIDKTRTKTVWTVQYFSLSRSPSCSFLSFIILFPPTHSISSTIDSRLDSLDMVTTRDGYPIGNTGLLSSFYRLTLNTHSTESRTHVGFLLDVVWV